MSLIKKVIQWIYNLLKLNNTKHRLINLEQTLKEVQLKTDRIEKEISEKNKLIEKEISEKNKLNIFLDEYYLAFENRFRGSRKGILQRYEKYLHFIQEDIEKSLDIGCGRGEWVELLQQRGIEAEGIDLNASMVQIGKENGVKSLKVGDAFEYLKSLKDKSYDLISAFHIIEHIPYEQLIELLIEVKRVAKPNAIILLETPNPLNLLVASNEFYKDPTHLNPLPSDVIKFLVEYLGFVDVRVEFLHPMPLSKNIDEDTKVAKLINGLLYQAQDYLIIAKRPPRQLLVDISGLMKYDSKTGIPRVVKAQLQELIKQLPQDTVLKTIYLKKYNAKAIHFYCENNFKESWEDRAIILNKGDVLYSPDLAQDAVNDAVEANLYTQYKKRGVKICFLVYDILPITHPQFFVEGQDLIHKKWLNNILSVADHLITISQTVAKDLESYTNLPITPIRIGTNFKKRSTITQFETISSLKALTVGTIEPRKGYEQLLEAFELLWEDGLNVKLYIVGKIGWNMKEFIEKLNTHPQLGENLFFLKFVNDEELKSLYRLSNVLILPSQAEGFGLPLIEAASYNLPIIARDIPVFHEVSSINAYYFSNTLEARILAITIKEWIELYKVNKHPKSINMEHPSWEQNVHDLLRLLLL